MKIKITQSFFMQGYASFVPGELLDIDNTTAHAFINSGFAVSTEKPVRETATHGKSREKAVKR
jgi:hypothetical protein